MVWCGFKNGCRKDVCLKEIGLQAQDIIINLSSIVDIIGIVRDHLMSTGIFTLMIE